MISLLLKFLKIKRIRHIKHRQPKSRVSFNEQIYDKISYYNSLIKIQHEKIDTICEHIPIDEYYEFISAIKSPSKVIDELKTKRRILYELILPINENAN